MSCTNWSWPRLVSSHKIVRGKTWLRSSNLDEIITMSHWRPRSSQPPDKDHGLLYTCGRLGGPPSWNRHLLQRATHCTACVRSNHIKGGKGVTWTMMGEGSKRRSFNFPYLSIIRSHRQQTKRSSVGWMVKSLGFEVRCIWIQIAVLPFANFFDLK